MTEELYFKESGNIPSEKNGAASLAPKMDMGDNVKPIPRKNPIDELNPNPMGNTPIETYSIGDSSKAREKIMGVAKQAALDWIKRNRNEANAISSNVMQQFKNPSVEPAKPAVAAIKPLKGTAPNMQPLPMKVERNSSGNFVQDGDMEFFIGDIDTSDNRLVEKKVQSLREAKKQMDDFYAAQKDEESAGFDVSDF